MNGSRTLCENLLAERQRHQLAGGGHGNQYSTTPLNEARELVHDALGAWTASVHERIGEFGDEDV